MIVAVVNESTLVTAEDLAAMTAAVALQAVEHWAPAWNRQPPDVLHFGDLANVPPGAAIVAILDDADQAGVLGYHDVTPNGRPYGKVFARVILDGGTALDGPNSVAVTLSHEVLELLGDDSANYWAFDAANVGHALEMCDACEADAYEVDVDGRPVSVSDFVLPAYFGPGAPGPYDYLNTLPGPFTVGAGGYEIRMIGGAVSQRFGARYPDSKLAGKYHPASRTNRRATAGGAMVKA